MDLLTLLTLAVGLSMDAFAVSICKGLAMREKVLGKGVIIGLWFGGFQALMPWLGWFIGSRFQKYIEQFDHWIAFGLLAFIGGQMIYESLKEKEEVETEGDQLDIGQLFLMAIATSIDALAIGVTFALLPGVNIWTSIALIGCTTFMISFAGVGIGFRFGNKYEKKTQIVGGVILIVLGIKILLEHLGVLPF